MRSRELEVGLGRVAAVAATKVLGFVEGGMRGGGSLGRRASRAWKRAADSVQSVLVFPRVRTDEGAGDE